MAAGIIATVAMFHQQVRGAALQDKKKKDHSKTNNKYHKKMLRGHQQKLRVFFPWSHEV